MTVSKPILKSSRCYAYSSCSICVDKPLRRRVLLRSVGDGVRHDVEELGVGDMAMQETDFRQKVQIQ